MKVCSSREVTFIPSFGNDRKVPGARVRLLTGDGSRWVQISVFSASGSVSSTSPKIADRVLDLDMLLLGAGPDGYCRWDAIKHP